MSRLTTVAVALLVAAPALSPAPLPAQQLAEICRQHRRFTLGQWAMYSSTGSDTGVMRFAIVGLEGAGDAARLTYEMQFTNIKRGRPQTTIMQMLVSGLGTPRPTVHGLVIKNGDEPAMKMPDMMLSAMSGQMLSNIAQEVAKNCEQATVVGWESVTVPAGTFRALHVRSAEGGDAWVARDVPFGMVRVRDKRGTLMVLTGHGRDARSAIREQPREMGGGRRP